MKKAPSWLFTAMRQWNSLRNLSKTFNNNTTDGVTTMKNFSHLNIAGRQAYKPAGGYCNEFVTWHLVKNGLPWDDIPSRADTSILGQGTKFDRLAVYDPETNKIIEIIEGDGKIPYSPTGRNVPLGRSWVASLGKYDKDQYFGIGYNRDKNRDNPNAGPWWPGRSRGKTQYWWGIGEDFDWSDVPAGAIIMPVEDAKTSYQDSLGTSHVTMYMGLGEPHVNENYWVGGPRGSRPKDPGKARDKWDKKAKKARRQHEGAKRVWCLGGNQSAWVQPKDYLEVDCKSFIIYPDYLDDIADAPTAGAYYQHWMEGDMITLPDGYEDWQVELIDFSSEEGLALNMPSPGTNTMWHGLSMKTRREAFPLHYRVFPKGYYDADNLERFDKRINKDESIPVVFIHVADESQVPVLGRDVIAPQPTVTVSPVVELVVEVSANDMKHHDDLNTVFETVFNSPSMFTRETTIKTAIQIAIEDTFGALEGTTTFTIDMAAEMATEVGVNVGEGLGMEEVDARECTEEQVEYVVDSDEFSFD